MRNSFSEFLRRDSREALGSTSGAFVELLDRMFRCFSSSRKGVRQYEALPARFSNSGFPSRELKCNSSLNTKLMSAECGFLQPRPLSRFATLMQIRNPCRLNHGPSQPVSLQFSREFSLIISLLHRAFTYPGFATTPPTSFNFCPLLNFLFF